MDDTENEVAPIENEVPVDSDAEAQPEKVSKSVVPADYAKKYNGTHEERGDDIGAFFRKQVDNDDGKIDLDKWVAFFETNGMESDDEFITKRIAWINEEKNGAQGRLAMDGRNKCVSLARAQEDRLKGSNGRWTKFELPERKKPPKNRHKKPENEVDGDD